jgi:hypothetical protein
MMTKDKYVVWDGIDEEPYTEETEDILRHQCLITIEGETLSVSEMLEVVHKNPLLVPTIIFSCKDGQAAVESERRINGEWRDFGYYWLAVLKQDPTLTFRDAISRVNIVMYQERLEQRAEVICRVDVLDMPVEDVSLPGEKHLTMFMDMCRTKSGRATGYFH